jgi:hypothetical protein
MTEKNAERRMEREEIVPDSAGIHATIPETYDGRGAATNLSGALRPEARQSLPRPPSPCRPTRDIAGAGQRGVPCAIL